MQASLKSQKTNTGKAERLSLPAPTKNSIDCACCGETFIDYVDLPDLSKIDRTLTDLSRTDSKRETRLLSVQRLNIET